MTGVQTCALPISPKVDDNFNSLSLPEDIYADAVLTKPGIKAAQYRLQGASKNIRIAQSNWYPQLSFGAGLGTSYYKIAGEENVSFNSQWHQNFNKYFQFSLSIPLFNRFETRNRVKMARIQRTALSWKLEVFKQEKMQVEPRGADRSYPSFQIGRASCRERV